MNDRQEAFGGREHLRRYTFVPALRIGDLVWISGTTAVDENNNIVGSDIVQQAAYIFEKFEVVLNELGGTCRDIVQTTDYIVTTDRYKHTAELRAKVFGDAKPTSTGVLVAGLLRPGALIEISAMAVIAGKADQIASQSGGDHKSVSPANAQSKGVTGQGANQ